MPVPILTPRLPEADVAQQSRVVQIAGLLNAGDRACIEKVRQEVATSGDLHCVTDKLENSNCSDKRCTFLHRRFDLLSSLAPGVLDKVIQFASQASNQEGWYENGPLVGLPAVHRLRTRVVEHWEYQKGGKLDDPWHYDAGSVVTVVVLLQDNFEGGIFRTHEANGIMLEHPLQIGEAVCFVSHKFHNVTAVTAGIRKSLVVEFWDPTLSIPFLTFGYQPKRKHPIAQIIMSLFVVLKRALCMLSTLPCVRCGKANPEHRSDKAD